MHHVGFGQRDLVSFWESPATVCPSPQSYLKYSLGACHSLQYSENILPMLKREIKLSREVGDHTLVGALRCERWGIGTE